MVKRGFSSSSMKEAWVEAKKKHPHNVELQRKYVMNHAKPKPKPN